jgi:hypothetical protein
VTIKSWILSNPNLDPGPGLLQSLILPHSSTGCFTDMGRFQVLTAESMKMTVFRDVAPCSLVEVYRLFSFFNTAYGKTKYSAFTDKVERNSHFPAPDCVTHRQALQGFPDMSQVALHKNNKINLPIHSSPCREPEVTIAFNFISERTIQCK